MRRLREYGSYGIGFASLFLLWHVAAVYLVQSALFPPPGSVIARAVALFRDGTLVANVAISLQRILTGFVCGSLLGIPIGLAMGSFAPIRRILDPYTEFLRFIPAVAMRSEEHTSELQSPCNLVCRLLLEKKKKWRMT